jgi:hypothetical protein
MLAGVQRHLPQLRKLFDIRKGETDLDATSRRQP